MRMDAVAPTFVLLHGSWHGGWAWAALEARLQELGAHTVALTLPGRDRAKGDPSFAGHCAFLQRELAAMTGPVVLVAHSYGGVIATEVGDAAAVSGMVLISAFALLQGENIAQIIDGDTASASGANALVSTGDGFLQIDAGTAIASFYHDCDPAVAAAAAAQLTPEFHDTRTARVTRSAWKQVPSHFIVCTDDRALPPKSQRILARRLVSVSKISSGHSPMLSRPSELADQLLAAAARFEANPAT